MIELLLGGCKQSKIHFEGVISITQYREILRLNSLNFSQQNIADSMPCI